MGQTQLGPLLLMNKCAVEIARSQFQTASWRGFTLRERLFLSSVVFLLFHAVNNLPKGVKLFRI